MKNKINPQERKEVINTFNHQKKLIMELNQRNKLLKNKCDKLQSELDDTRRVGQEREYTLVRQNLYLFLTCIVLIIVTATVLIKEA